MNKVCWPQKAVAVDVRSLSINLIDFSLEKFSLCLKGRIGVCSCCPRYTCLNNFY